MHGDDVVAADEEIDLGGAGDLVPGIPERKVHNGEDVVVVLVELGPLDRASYVLQIERVEVREAPAEAVDIGFGRVRQVEPGKVAVGDDSGGHEDDLTTEETAGTEEFSPQVAPALTGDALGKVLCPFFLFPTQKLFRTYLCPTARVVNVHEVTV